MSFNRPGVSDAFLLDAGVEIATEPPDALFRIPYYDRKARRTGHYRVRLKEVRPDGQKYNQPAGSGVHVYFPHLPLLPCQRLWVTEGEFKALSMWEAGNQTIGLPGLHSYENDANGNPQILQDLFDAVRFVDPKEIVFIGDSDTILNIEYYRSAHFLATVFRQIPVYLLQIPFGSPEKGIDDLRQSLDGEFPDRLEKLYLEALRSEPEESFLLPAALRLKGLALNKSIDALSPEQQIKQRRRVCQMAAWAKLAKDQPQAIAAQFLGAAKAATGFNQEVFTSSVEDEVKAICGEAAPEKVANDKVNFYAGIQPWPVDRPLEDIIAEVRAISARYVITDPRNFLLTACWGAHTFAFRESAYLPLLLFTGAEEDSGKSTYLRVVGRFSSCAYMLIATSAIHRILTVYQGTFLLDESKQLSENKDLISFLNSGFDNTSMNPVDCPVLTRWDMESGTLQEYDPRFPKALAGIGTFLERDTLSRSLIITMERYLLSESRRVSDYIYCKDGETLPVYRAFLTYWTEERKKIFAARCRSVIPQFPEEFRSRKRLKFVPLLAIAEMASPEIYEETMEAAKWKLNAPDSRSPGLTHRLLCDVALCFFRQWWLCRLNANDPITGEPHSMVKQGEAFLLPTTKLISLLHKLPEGPWKSYGPQKKELNSNGLYEMLGAYDLNVGRLKRNKVDYRGVLFQPFHEKYQRYVRSGDPTMASVLNDLIKEGMPFPDDDPPEGGSPKPESEAPTGPDTPSSGADEKSGDAADAGVSSNSESTSYPASPVSEKEEISESADAEETPDVEQVTCPASPASPLFPAEGKGRVYIPPSTSQASFCTPSHPERLLFVDIETFYPWGESYSQPDTYTAGQLLKRRREGKSHPWASDPRRCAMRFLTVHDTEGTFGAEPLTIDFQENPELPANVLGALSTHTLVGHNLDFDLTVLRRYGIEVSFSIIDTMLASRLLGLGKEKPKFGRASHEDLNLDEVEGLLSEEENAQNPVDHALGATVRRYLGIKIKKVLGASDWGRKDISADQFVYMAQDVSVLPSLWEAMRPELHGAGLEKVFVARMEFFHHLNQVKMIGVPVDGSTLEADLQRVSEEKEHEAEELSVMFANLDNTFEIPKSRKKKVEIKTEEGKPKLIAGPTHEGFHASCRNQHWIPALASHGISVENTQEPTLRRIDKPETRALLKYASAAKRLSEIKGISRSLFPDGRVRAENWNQLSARTGRMTSTHPNLQQVPRDWRTGFRVEPPQLWLKGDLSQIEMLLIAVTTGDPNMIEMIRAGKDIYVEYGARIFSKKPERGEGDDQITDPLREVAKKPTLGISYGLTPWGFVRTVREELGLEYTVEEAEGFFEQYFEMFPGVAAYYNTAEENARYQEVVHTIAGTRRWLPSLVGEPSDDWETNKAFRKSLAYRRNILLNTPIQGSGADLVIWSANQFMPQLPAGVEITNLVHDEVDAIVTQETLRPTVGIITRAFQETFAQFYPSSPLTPGIKFSVGPSWGGLTKLEL